MRVGIALLSDAICIEKSSNTSNFRIKDAQYLALQVVRLVPGMQPPKNILTAEKQLYRQKKHLLTPSPNDNMCHTFKLGNWRI